MRNPAELQPRKRLGLGLGLARVGSELTCKRKIDQKVLYERICKVVLQLGALVPEVHIAGAISMLLRASCATPYNY